MQRAADRAAIEFLRLPDRPVVREAGPRFYNRLALIDALEQRAHKRFGRELASTEPSHELDGGQFVQTHAVLISCRASADAS